MRTIKHTLYRLGGGAVIAATSAQVAMAVERPKIDNPVGNGTNLGSVLGVVINGLLLFAGAVAVLFLIIGGFRYIVSTGNEQQVAGAKNTILYAILGLIIIFIAFVLVKSVQNILGVQSGFSVLGN